jgi:TRAP-type C4-dicarboxylate transport system permease small subunit
LSWKLTVAYIGWLLAAIAIAIVFGVLTSELLALVGLVDSLSREQRRVIEVVSVAAFVVLALLPFLLRRRLTRSDDEATT